MHMQILKRCPLALALAAVLGQPATAGLYAVDPGPYTIENGEFAAWYQDTHGRALALCLSKATSSRVGPDPVDGPSYMCPFPGLDEGFDASLPVAFPNNFPSEGFWFTGDAEIVDAASGIDLTYVAALEAFFITHEVVDGDQVSFARIRVRVDVPTPGIYTVTHPYGVEVFEVTQEVFDDTEGDGAINMTRDLGIGAPKTYTGALGGNIGPFLRSLNGPYTEINPLTGEQERYIGDPNLEEEVTGSPFSTNYVRIEGPNGIDLRTNLFAVSGKLANVVLPTPLQVERATYSRSQQGDSLVAQQDVFIQAPPAPATTQMLDSVGTATSMSETTATGSWYGQSETNPTLPASVQLSAENALAIPESTASVVQANLIDQITIHRAEYRVSTGQLTIEATSSDETAPPALTAFASNGAVIGALAGGVIKTLSTGFSPIPPASVQVSSANGGSDIEEVVLIP